MCLSRTCRSQRRVLSFGFRSVPYYWYAHVHGPWRRTQVLPASRQQHHHDRRGGYDRLHAASAAFDGWPMSHIRQVAQALRKYEKDTKCEHHAVDQRERPGNTNRKHFPDESTSGASNTFGRPPCSKQERKRTSFQEVPGTRASAAHWLTPCSKQEKRKTASFQEVPSNRASVAHWLSREQETFRYLSYALHYVEERAVHFSSCLLRLFLC